LESIDAKLGQILSTSPQARQLESVDTKLDQIVRLSKTAESLRPALDDLKSSLVGANQRIESLKDQVEKLQRLVQQPEEFLDPAAGPEVRSILEAEKLFNDLGNSPTATQLAAALEAVNEWIFAPAALDAFQRLKANKLALLRKLVKTEVEALHQQALNSESGAKAVKSHAEASRILALYPIDSTRAVLDEARNLSSRHSEVRIRIDVIRRQRYNAWALDRITEAMKEINAIASSFTTSDNPKIIEATVRHLGEIAPLLLEPVVSQLYNYVVEQASTKVNSDQKLELGRRLIDPSIKRKAYGDF
jgi:hypothetical protein